MSTPLSRCQTSSHLHINTIVFNINIQACAITAKTLVSRNNKDPRLAKAPYIVY